MNLPNPFPGVSSRTRTDVQISAPITTTSSYKFKKAGKNGVLITAILDESGSMRSCWSTTISGFNEYVNGQRSADASAGEASLTLMKFDAPQIHTVYVNRPINEIPALTTETYKPNGGTNLFDAIGDAITSVQNVLTSKKKKDRPGVIITIMTDGEENSSRRYNSEQLKEMVKAAEDADWTFTFLGANINVFAVGSTFGMSALNSVSYSTANMAATMSATSASTTRMRSAKMAGASNRSIYENGLYTSAELKSMK